MKPPTKAFGPKEEAWIEAILDGATIEDACSVSGVAVPTGRKWHSGALRSEIYEEVQRRRAQMAERSAALREEGLEKRAQEQFTSFEAVVADLKRVGQAAEEKGNLKVWLQTIVERGKLGGLYVQKMEHTGKLTVADIIGSVDLDAE